MDILDGTIINNLTNSELVNTFYTKVPNHFIMVEINNINIFEGHFRDLGTFGGH